LSLSDYYLDEMFQRNSSNPLRLHRFAAIALALWLSGLSCLLCCGTLMPADFTAIRQSRSA
jgi:hypothetical protein